MQLNEAKFALIYRKFRSGKLFLLALMTIVVAWLGLHFMSGTDKDFGGLNLFLSIEASVGMTLFMMVSDKQDKQHAETLAYIEHILEAQYTQLEATISYLEQTDGK